MFERAWRKWGPGALQRVRLSSTDALYAPHALSSVACAHCKARLGTDRLLVKYYRWYHLAPCLAEAHPERAEADRQARRGIKTTVPKWADEEDYD